MEYYRKKNKITQEELGKRLGITKQYAWYLEGGLMPLSYKMAFKISKILDSTPDELFLEDYKKGNND